MYIIYVFLVQLCTVKRGHKAGVRWQPNGRSIDIQQWRSGSIGILENPPIWVFFWGFQQAIVEELCSSAPIFSISPLQVISNFFCLFLLPTSILQFFFFNFCFHFWFDFGLELLWSLFYSQGRGIFLWLNHLGSLSSVTNFMGYLMSHNLGSVYIFFLSSSG